MHTTYLHLFDFSYCSCCLCYNSTVGWCYRLRVWHSKSIKQILFRSPAYKSYVNKPFGLINKCIYLCFCIYCDYYYFYKLIVYIVMFRVTFFTFCAEWEWNLKHKQRLEEGQQDKWSPWSHGHSGFLLHSEIFALYFNPKSSQKSTTK